MKKLPAYFILFVLFTVFAGVPIADAACTTQGASCSLGGGQTGVCEPNALHTGLVCGLGTTVNQPPVQQTSGGTGFVPIAPIPGLTQGVAANTAGLQNFLNNLYRYLIGFAAALAVVEIIWGGLEISTKDSVSKRTDGKQRITQAILGLVLILSPVLIFAVINPSILNLSISLQPLDTQPGSGTVTSGSGTAGGTQNSAQNNNNQAAAPAGCTVTGTLLKTATCQTQAEAQSFAANCTTGPGRISSSYFTSTYSATCGTTQGPVTGPYSFADTSQSTGPIGWLNLITGYSYYQPIASTASNPNNGTQVINFANTCTNDQGTTCMSTVKTVCASSIVQLLTTGSHVSCWNISLSCTDGSVGAGGCSSSPDFQIVQIQ